MKKALSIALAAVATVSAAPAMAQFQKPEDAIKYRKAAFTVTAAPPFFLSKMPAKRMLGKCSLDGSRVCYSGHSTKTNGLVWHSSSVSKIGEKAKVFRFSFFSIIHIA